MLEYYWLKSADLIEKLVNNHVVFYDVGRKKTVFVIVPAKLNKLLSFFYLMRCQHKFLLVIPVVAGPIK